MMSMTVLGVAQTVAKFAALARAAEAANDKILDEAGATIEERAKQLAPVRTGALKDSITTKRDGDDEYVGTEGIEYARFQEFGFIHVGSGQFIINPFLRPAAEGAAPEILNTSSILLGAAIRAVVGI